MVSQTRAESSQVVPSSQIHPEDLIGRALNQKIAYTEHVWDVIPDDSILSTFRNLRQFEGNELSRRQYTVLAGARYLYQFRTALRLSFPLAEETTTLPELVRLDLEVQRRMLFKIFWTVVTNSCSGQENSSAHKFLKHLETIVYGYTWKGLLSKIHGAITCNPSLAINYSDLRNVFYVASRGEHHIAMRALLSLAEKRNIDIPLNDLLDWVSQSSGYVFRTAKEVLKSIQDPERFHLLAVAALMGSKSRPDIVRDILSLMDKRKQKFTEDELKRAIVQIMETDASIQNKDLCIGMLQSTGTQK